MPNRPLVLVCGLTIGDYLLWNWSLNNNHDVLALVSGLTLPPLAVVAFWLLALSVARLLAYSARRARLRGADTRGGRAAGSRGRPAHREQPAPAPPASAPSRKIAA